ncbi:MAG TPA: O-antigen ligase family protein [Usitatibacter sp.]
MPLIRPASGAQRVFVASAAAFLLVAAFPSSAGWRVFFLVVALASLSLQAAKGDQALELGRIPRPFALAAIAWAALAMASLAWSVDPGYTQQELRREIAYGSLSFLVFFIGTRAAAQLHLWMKMLALATIVLGIGEWLHLLHPEVEMFDKASMGPGPFSTHVVMIAPLLLLALWPAPVGMGRSLRLTLTLGAFLVVAGMSGESRILWPALLAAALVAFIAFSLQAGPAHPGRIAAKRALVVTIVLLPVLMVISAEYKLRYYPQAASTMESFALDARPLIWRTAVREAAEHPWLGHGYGREIVAPKLRAELAKAGELTPYNHGHNVFLDAVLELGALGLAAFVFLVGALAWAFAQAGKREGGAPLAIAGLAVFTGYLVKNLTDDFFFRPNSLVFWAIAGMLMGLAARLPAKS